MSQIFFNTINNDQYDFMTEWDTTVMDKWVAENIGLSRCKDEAELFETKWFDYRDMHPLMATCLFTEAYKRQYSYIMLSHGREHYETAQFTTGLKRVPYQELSTANKHASLPTSTAALITTSFLPFFPQLHAVCGTNYLAPSISGSPS